MTLNFITVAGVAGYFVYSCVKKTPAISALVFSILLFAGAFGGGGSYKSVAFSRAKSFARGIEEKRVVISCDCTLKKGLRYLRRERYLVFVLYEGDEFFGEMTEGEYLNALSEGDYAKTFRECTQTF